MTSSNLWAREYLSSIAEHWFVTGQTVSAVHGALRRWDEAEFRAKTLGAERDSWKQMYDGLAGELATVRSSMNELKVHVAKNQASAVKLGGAAEDMESRLRQVEKERDTARQERDAVRQERDRAEALLAERSETLSDLAGRFDLLTEDNLGMLDELAAERESRLKAEENLEKLLMNLSGLEVDLGREKESHRKTSAELMTQVRTMLTARARATELLDVLYDKKCVLPPINLPCENPAPVS